MDPEDASLEVDLSLLQHLKRVMRDLEPPDICLTLLCVINIILHTFSAAACLCGVHVLNGVATLVCVSFWNYLNVLSCNTSLASYVKVKSTKLM